MRHVLVFDYCKHRTCFGAPRIEPAERHYALTAVLSLIFASVLLTRVARITKRDLLTAGFGLVSGGVLPDLPGRGCPRAEPEYGIYSMTRTAAVLERGRAAEVGRFDCQPQCPEKQNCNG